MTDLSQDSKGHKPSDEEREKMLRQLQMINKLATRLPWIVLGISLFAFIVIFLQIYFTRT